MTKEEQAKKIEEIYQSAVKKMNEHGQKALLIIKSIIKKREERQIEILSKKLKE
ncbi:MAG: hypothetical protein WCI93_03855 [bacterium]